MTFSNGAAITSSRADTEFESQSRTTRGRADIVDGGVPDTALQDVNQVLSVKSQMILTTRHIVAGDGRDRRICTWSAFSITIVRLTDTGSVTLVLPVDEEGRKESMGVRNRGEAEDGGEKLHNK